MTIYSLGSIMQEIHSLHYPIRDSNKFVEAFSVFGEVYVKGNRIDKIAGHIKYPVYSGGDCISKILDAVKAMGGKPVPEERTYHGPTFMPRSKEAHAITQSGASIKRIDLDMDTKTAVEQRVKIGDIDRRLDTLGKIKASAGIPELKGRDESMDVQREKTELELKTALIKMSMEKEEEIKYRLELELKKKELEIEVKEAERERNNRMEIELKKKQLEIEVKEAERERNNRMEIELKKKEMELKAKEEWMEREIEKRIQIAVKEKEAEIERKMKAVTDEKIESMRKKMEEEFRRKEELVRKRISLEEREKALRGR